MSNYAGWTYYVDGGNGSSTGWYAVAQWAASHAYTVGQVVRQQAAPSAGNERVFVCVVAGTSGGTEPAWSLNFGTLTTDNTVSWYECTGQAALNGDSAGVPNWTTRRAFSSTTFLGEIIKNDAATHYFIVTTVGNSGSSEPTWNTTAGATTVDSTTTWTCLGAISSFSTTWAAPMRSIVHSSNTTWTTQNLSKVFVSSAHTESWSTSITIWSYVQSVLQDTQVYCVTKTSSPPVAADVTTGASVSTTGASTITFNSAGIAGAGRVRWHGVSFSAGSGSSTASITFCNSTGGTNAYWKSCTFTLNGTSVTSRYNLDVTNANNEQLIFESCTFLFQSTSQSFTASLGPGNTKFVDCVFASSGQVPTTLFINGTQYTHFSGCDFTAFGGKTLLAGGGSTAQRVLFQDCAVNATATVVSAISGTQTECFVSRCSSTYDLQKHSARGDQTVSTSVRRSGGASDGATSYSWQIATASGTINRFVYWPFVSTPIVAWSESTGPTVTVYGTWNGGAVPNDDDVWLEIEYHSDVSGFGAIMTTTSRPTTLVSAGLPWQADSSAWSGGATPFKMTARLQDPQPGPGFLYVFVKVALASNTIYIDPRIELTT